MLSNLSLIADSIFQFLTAVFNLYTGQIVLTGVLAIWLLRKVVNVFRKL